MADEGMVTLSMRVPVEWAGRLDALVEPMGQDSNYSAFRITRSTVARQAMQLGIEKLEQAYNEDDSDHQE